MKCPSCFSTMKCISAIHKVPGQPGRERMDLHCPNKGNVLLPGVGSCYARCHMGVITEDPKVWECHEYNFSFSHQGSIYYLSSYNNLVDPYHQKRDYGAKTILATYSRHPIVLIPGRRSSWGFEEPVVTLPYFMPLSTDNDMHERAWELFHRLRNLIIYS